MQLRTLLCCFALASAACFPSVAASQAYPARPITMVVPFPPGGSVDSVARRLSQKLGSILGQTVVVDNRSGAGGTIGAAHVAASAPDGYTLMFATSSALAVSPALYRNISYDPLVSFVPVIEITRGPWILSVRIDHPAKSAKEFIELAKSKPGKLNYGSAGQGSAHHLAMETLKQEAGIDLVHIPYKGGAPSWIGLMGGEIDAMFDSMPGPLLYPGRVRALAVTSPARLSQLPDTPTFAEIGLPGVDSKFFFGIVAPKDTPADIVNTLNRAARLALDDSEVRGALVSQNLDPTPGTPDDFAALLRTEVPRFKELVRKVGLSIQ